MEINVTAYPKLNIFLFVGAKRKDGYQEIMSLFQKTDCFRDEICLRYEDASSTQIAVSGLENCVSEKESTVYKACTSWLKATGRTAAIDIDITKGIPVKAGLGGGSSDAGAVILALERCTGNKLGIKALVKVALEVGSDVPFFVYGCDAAIVSGRGEVVHPIEIRNDLEFDVFLGAQPKKGTKEAYELLDSRGECSVLPTGADLVYAYRENPAQWGHTNDFALLYEKPCKDAFLTGSGNAWFTIRIIK